MTRQCLICQDLLHKVTNTHFVFCLIAEHPDINFIGQPVSFQKIRIFQELAHLVQSLIYVFLHNSSYDRQLKAGSASVILSFRIAFSSTGLISTGFRWSAVVLSR